MGINIFVSVRSNSKDHKCNNTAKIWRIFFFKQMSFIIKKNHPGLIYIQNYRASYIVQEYHISSYLFVSEN